MKKKLSRNKKRFNFCYFNVHHVAIKIGNKNVCCPPNDANNQCIRNHDNEKFFKKRQKKKFVTTKNMTKNRSIIILLTFVIFIFDLYLKIR